MRVGSRWLPVMVFVIGAGCKVKDESSVRPADGQPRDETPESSTRPPLAEISPSARDAEVEVVVEVAGFLPENLRITSQGEDGRDFEELYDETVCRIVDPAGHRGNTFSIQHDSGSLPVDSPWRRVDARLKFRTYASLLWQEEGVTSVTLSDRIQVQVLE